MKVYIDYLVILFFTISILVNYPCYLVGILQEEWKELGTPVTNYHMLNCWFILKLCFWPLLLNGDCMVGNEIVLISRFHVTELCSVRNRKFPLYVCIGISSAVLGDESNVHIIAVTACWVICQKTSDFYESPNLSGVVILWADLKGEQEEFQNVSDHSWSDPAASCFYYIKYVVCFLRLSLGFGGNWEGRKFPWRKIWKQLILFLKQKYFHSGKGHISHSCGEIPKC